MIHPLFTYPNVVGVGRGFARRNGMPIGQEVTVVLVSSKLPLVMLSAEEVVPPEFEGERTDVIEVGIIRALQGRTGKHRPAPGGVSIGHYQITAGTLGVVVHDAQSGERLILSNNHVLANSNDARLDDPILQPGPADGGIVSRDTIATLDRFQPIDFGDAPPTCPIAGGAAAVANLGARLTGSRHRLLAYRAAPQAVNTVDAALARPLQDSDVLDSILEIGNVEGTKDASLGQRVRKSGRTTGLTSDQVIVLDATVQVQYGAGKVATFEHQIVAGPMSAGGDSGSLVVDANEQRAVGLLFAGSDQVTILNPISEVLSALGVTL